MLITADIARILGMADADPQAWPRPAGPEVLRRDQDQHPAAPHAQRPDESHGPLLHSWTEADKIMAWMCGEEFDVDPLTEARELEPKAFGS